MAEKILVPLDGSELGEAALKYVDSFLSKLTPEKHATIVLLHVITELTHQIDLHGEGAGIVSVPFTQDEIKDQQGKSEAYLKKAAERLVTCGAKIETQVVVGTHPAEEIVKAEDECGCDLVAMSTHGRSGISRWAFGSVTDKVLRGGQVPVLMVRAS